MKSWCQKNVSPHRFYFQEIVNSERYKINHSGIYVVSPVNSKWWFENSEDATVFKLKWGYRNG